MSKFSTREEWLLEGIQQIRPLFIAVGSKVPAKTRVSCGFPSKQAMTKKRMIGECWSDKASAGKVIEIFISPVLQKPFDVLNTLIHEATHAAVGVEHGHKAPFTQLARRIGLTRGKPTNCGAGDELGERINGIIKVLGPYPHDELQGMVTLPKAKDKCRLLKAECPKCGYIIRVTKKWVEEAGLPICPCGKRFECEIAE